MDLDEYIMMEGTQAEYSNETELPQDLSVDEEILEDIIPPNSDSEDEEDEQIRENRQEDVGQNTKLPKLRSLNHLRHPMAILRYMAVRDLIEQSAEKFCFKKYCEFGCAELKFLQYVVNLDLPLEEINLIDINKQKLKHNIRKALPHLRFYCDKKETPLTVFLYVGSMAQPDPILKNTDAVVAIEVIEHLYPNVLEAVPYNIFGFMRPKLVIFTTPNSEFNVLFAYFRKVRDPDHKFEWTREQFQDWAINITNRFPEYEVKFEGIGEGVDGTEHLGCVTQLAMFERTESREFSDTTDGESFGICTYCAVQPDITSYTLLDEIEYPCKSREDAILMKVVDFINECREDIESPFRNIKKKRLEIAVSYLVSKFNEQECKLRDKIILTDAEEVSKILKTAAYDIVHMRKDGEELQPYVHYLEGFESSDEDEDEDLTKEGNVPENVMPPPLEEEDEW